MIIDGWFILEIKLFLDLFVNVSIVNFFYGWFSNIFFFVFLINVEDFLDLV